FPLMVTSCANIVDVNRRSSMIKKGCFIEVDKAYAKMCKVFRRALLIIVKQKGVFISKHAFFIAEMN
ncbi:hypothetical protein, partial [Mucilaginibacter sp.]|uniref:hypothetical protein n=1 Tax=Mucilaginibacter sp. TaxID=1882438 RepID=UPI0026370BB1